MGRNDKMSQWISYRNPEESTSARTNESYHKNIDSDEANHCHLLVFSVLGVKNRKVTNEPPQQSWDKEASSLIIER